LKQAISNKILQVLGGHPSTFHKKSLKKKSDLNNKKTICFIFLIMILPTLAGTIPNV